MTKPRWPVVLFDFDGTLGDSIALIVASFTHALQLVMGEQAVEAEIRSWIGRPLLAVLEESHPGHADELIAAYRAYYVDHHDKLIRPIAGVVELLGALRGAGAGIGVVSSKRADFVRLGLGALGLDDHVALVVGHDETALHKPDPEPLLFAADHFGARPGDCVYVGDALVDVAAALAAGMDAVAVTWGAGLAELLSAAGATAVVHDTEALRGVLLPATPAVPAIAI